METAAVEFLGGFFLLVAGLLALAFTSYCFAGALLLVLFDIDRFANARGSYVRTMNPYVFGGTFLVIVVVTFVYSWQKRQKRSLMRLTDFKWEFFCAGPILLIMAAEDFYACVRMIRMDIEPVTKVLLWVYDKGGRVAASEIATAFPGLNTVRVLPQLRDVPGVNPWTDEGVIGLFEDLREELAALLGEKAYPGARSPGQARATWRADEWEPPPPPPSEPHWNEEIISWYKTMELPPFAPLAQVKKQYKKLVKIHHPDLRAGNRTTTRDTGDETIKRIILAYHKILKHSQSQADSVR